MPEKGQHGLPILGTCDFIGVVVVCFRKLSPGTSLVVGTPDVVIENLHVGLRHNLILQGASAYQSKHYIGSFQKSA